MVEGERSPVALLVDDEPSVRETVRSMLRRHGFTVLEAVGIADAARVAAEHEGTIDLLVVNHELRDGLGRQVIDKLRGQRPEIRALRYSGYPHEHLLQTGGIGEDSAFIQKPFRVDEFIAKVHEVLGWLPHRRRTAGDYEA